MTLSHCEKFNEEGVCTLCNVNSLLDDNDKCSEILFCAENKHP